MRATVLPGLILVAGLVAQAASAAPASFASSSSRASGPVPPPGAVASGSGYLLSNSVQEQYRRQLVRLRNEALALQAKDGGKLTDADRKSLQAQLDALNSEHGAHLLRAGG